MTIQAKRPLDLSDSYPCPICRHGEIQALVLTDAFACQFCRHILSVDLAQQKVQVIDSPQAISWFWNGHRWQIAGRNEGAHLSGVVILAALILIIFPAGLVWLTGAIFPPLSSSSHMRFPTIWALLTLLAHLCIVLWMIGEYFQVPFYIATKVRLMRRNLSQEY